VVESRAGAREYARHQPEKTLLYQVVLEHLSTFLSEMAATGRALPRYVVAAFEAYLACGILACGFSRAYCVECQRSLVVAFSCKKRGPCPSCGARRMAGEAAFLVARVLPDVPVRQWVLSLPFELRAACALRPDVLRAVHKRFVDVVSAWLREQAKAHGTANAQPGAVTFVQRFGSTLNANVHFHAVFFDGAFIAGAPGEPARFVRTRAPTETELVALSARIEAKVTRWLKRGGLLRAAGDDASESEEQAATTGIEACVQTTLSLGELAAVDERGTVRVAERRRGPRRTGTGAHRGYSLHAAVALAAGDRAALERLLRYCARPALSLERLRATADGRYAYELSYPSAGRTHLVMTPLALLSRLSALVAPPRYPLVRYSGVLAPAHPMRPLVVRARNDGANGSHHKHATKAASPKAGANEPAKRVVPVERSAAAAPSRTPEPAPPLARRGELLAAATPWIPWAELLKRTFDIDALACPCGGRLRFIALVTEPSAIEPLLENLGLPTKRPVRARARAPTWFEVDAMPAYDT
jgi:hypothetical protein